MFQGFKKVDPDKWEFANEGFLRGQKHLLKNIKRRKTASSSNQVLESCLEVRGEIEQLKREKQALVMELVKLRQQQQQTKSHLKQMEQRLQGTEVKQMQTMKFLAKAIKNPSFMAMHKGKMKEIDEEMGKKKMKMIDAAAFNDHDAYVEEVDGIGGGFDAELDLEFETFVMSSMNMEEQILHDQDNNNADDIQDHDLGVDIDMPFDEGFWGDLINNP